MQLGRRSGFLVSAFELRKSSQPEGIRAHGVRIWNSSELAAVGELPPHLDWRCRLELNSHGRAEWGHANDMKQLCFQ